MREGGLTEKQLGAVFTCGAWSVQGGRFLVGLARDAYGTRVTVCSCLVLVVLGSTLVATCASDDFPGMCFGMLFLGMGSGAQLCVQPVTGLFPERSSTAMATLSGAFQISGLVFLLCSGIGGAGAGRLGAYLTHAALVAALMMVAARALPAGNSFRLEEDDEIDEKENIVDVGGSAGEAAPAPGEPRHFHKRSLRDLMMSDEYICLLVWFSVVVTPSQYYVLSIGYQLEQKGDADGEYTRAFTLMYGISAIFAPLGGAVADRFGIGFAQLVATTLTAASLFALLSPSLPLQIPGIAAYSVGRLFIFAMFFSNIGRRLGFTHYGALVGTGMLTSAVVSMLQYPLFTAGLEGGARWTPSTEGAPPRWRRASLTRRGCGEGRCASGEKETRRRRSRPRSRRGPSTQRRGRSSRRKNGRFIIHITAVVDAARLRLLTTSRPPASSEGVQPNNTATLVSHHPTVSSLV